MKDGSWLVFPIGSEVAIGEDITAKVLQVCISGKGVTYEVAWFDGNSRNTAWVHDCETTPADENKRICIGFRPVSLNESN